jgi:phosphoribosyl-ATP pyrophosphohydrolase/phosphoribosyl-AMP cyclohydrolase
MRSLTKKINWKKTNGLAPAIIQDAANGIVLMLSYMDKRALVKTEKTGFIWLYSRTKQRLWKKGETSGNTLRVKSIKLDCDSDALLVKVTPTGPACHTGDTSCFKEEKITDEIRELFSTIEKRKKELPKKSYTASLFRAGIDHIALKVSEESLEVVQAATKETKQRLVEETVDLLYHLFVLLIQRGVGLKVLEKEIKKRYPAQS